MNKSELVDFIAGEAEITKAAAARALEALDGFLPALKTEQA